VNMQYTQTIAGTYFLTLATPVSGGVAANTIGVGSSNIFTVVPNAGGSAALIGPGQLNSNVCTPYTLITSDTYGNPQGNAGAVSVNFASGPTATFYQDSACTTDLHGVGLVTLPNATTPTSQTIYVKSASLVSLGALSLHTMNGACTGNTIPNVSATTPVQLKVTPSTSPITGNGQCVVLNLTAVDSSGTARNMPANLNIAGGYVVGPQQGGMNQLYMNGTCNNIANNPVIASGSSSGQISFQAQGGTGSSVTVVVDDETNSPGNSCASGVNLGKVTQTISW
jgi:hypothetical protein